MFEQLTFFWSAYNGRLNILPVLHAGMEIDSKKVG